MKRIIALLLAMLIAPCASVRAEGDANALLSRGLQAWNDGAYEAAADFFSQAAEMGSAIGQLNLGIMYRSGTGVPQSYEQAAKWFKLAADQGNERALCYLGILYMQGSGVTQSYEQAAEYLRPAAAMGDDVAQYNLGMMYEYGDGVPQSYQQAADLYRQAADQGNRSAQVALGSLYDRGQGVEQSWEKAVEYFLLAAEQGDELGQFNMGICCQYGRGVGQSYEKAAEYYQLAADQGNDMALHKLGTLYRDGLGVEQSYEKAAELFRLAADDGYADAQLSLGVAYANGNGVEQSYEKAVEYFRLAADQGDTVALSNLGISYQLGQGVEQSDERAAEYFQLAADRGYVSAQYNLGLAYEHGRGVEQSYEQAAAYYLLAADQGHAGAQYNLGLAYERGRGVERSYEQAEKYYQLAADQGNSEAQARLDLLQAITAADPESADDAAALLLAQAKAAGMQIPEPAEGEALYLGIRDAEDSARTKLYLAFIAAPNRMSIRWISLMGEALEVPQEGRSPHPIDHEIQSREGYWILLDLSGTTDLLMDSQSGLGLFGLHLEDEAGACRMVVAGHLTAPEDPVDGDFHAEADMELLRVSGGAASAPVDPPTVSEAESAGMKLPLPGAGERLFLGAASVSQAQKVYVAFVLSEDGNTMRDLTVFCSGVDLTYRTESSRVQTTVSTHATHAENALEIADAVEAGSIRLTDFVLDGDSAEAVLRYGFLSNDMPAAYPFDPARVRFASVK